MYAQAPAHDGKGVDEGFMNSVLGCSVSVRLVEALLNAPSLALYAVR